MELIPIDSKQTLILIPAPPDPAQEDVSLYESKILENLPESSASIRLALLNGNCERVLSLMKDVLREQRHHCWMDIHSVLIRSLRFKPYEGDPKELSWDIPKDTGAFTFPYSICPPLSNIRLLSASSPSAIRFPVVHTIRCTAL